MIIRAILAMLVFKTCICLDPPHKELEKYPEYWMHDANTRLRESLKRLTPNTKPAKNVILIIGDGMDVATMTAGRIYKGQKYGTSGEEFQTTMDKFPYVGLSKVYTLNSQAPDSAGTGTALNTGVKTNSKMVGLSGQAVHNNCSSSIGNEIKTILEYSADQGKSTGIVTSTYLTHATPASAYAHAPNRQWKTDADLTEEAKLNGCKDIGSQLIEHGRKINVLLGGGRAFMRPKGYKDEEYGDVDDSLGGRNDNRNLIKEWIKLEGSDRAKYVWDQKGFDNVDPTNVDNLLGLFEPGDMRFEHDRRNDLAGEPSLAEMTAKAIEILRKNRDGYFLLVEGGKIDHGHHSAKANIALSEFAALDDAVKLATRMTNSDETLIVVTADHGHMFTAGGYAVRGNPITGLADDHEKPSKALDDVAYTSIVYGTGNDWLGNSGNRRLNRHASASFQMDFEFPSAIPLQSGTHSSTDVAVMARGPMSHLLSGIYEQNFIGYLMMYASCVGPDKRHCRSQRRFHTWDCSKYVKGSLFRKSSYNVRFSSISRQNKNVPWWCREVYEAEWTIMKPFSAPKSTYFPATRQSYEQDNTRPWQMTTRSNLPQRPTIQPKRKMYTTRPFRRLVTDTYDMRRATAPTTASYRKRQTTPNPRLARRKPVQRMSPKPPSIRNSKATTRPQFRRGTRTGGSKILKPTPAGNINNRENFMRRPKTTPMTNHRQQTTVRYSERKSQMWNRARTTEAPRTGTPTPSGKLNRKGTASKFHRRKNIQTGILNKRTRTNVRRRMTTATPHRIFRRELTTESEDDTISISNGENYRPSSTSPTPNSVTSGRGNFLDRLAKIIRSQLEYMTITSSSTGMTKLDLSLMVKPTVKNMKDSRKYKKSALSSTNETRATIVCIKWSSTDGLITLGPNSSEHSFIYKEPKNERQINRHVKAASATDNTAALVLLALFAVAFLLLTLGLLYQIRKRDAMIKEILAERNKEKLKAADSRMRLQDVDENDVVYEDINSNNNNVIERSRVGGGVETIFQVCTSHTQAPTRLK
uniref:uncharacterized protein LOC120345128 n=1 Tax=Styela clava TaxID=7725 RepID=UPI00193A77F9|nr:uncharacterized protein LOC120345128 [Styela clava]